MLPNLHPVIFFRRAMLPAAVWLLAAVGVAAAEEPAIKIPGFAYPPALPELLTSAARAGMAVDRFDAPPVRRPAAPGDSVTALISLRQRAELQQWALTMTVTDLAEKERQMPPLEALHAFSSTGGEFTFGGRRSAIELQLIGPLRRGSDGVVEGDPKTLHRRILVNADFLEVGFDAACEAVLSLRQDGNPSRAKLDYRTRHNPFPPEETEPNRVLAASLGLTPGRERAFVGLGLALPEFVKLIVRTPGLQDIMQKVIDVSWWSILTSGGKTKPTFKYMFPYVQKLEPNPPGEGLQQYVFPFLLMLTDKPAMSCMLVVSEPWGPFAVTGGVVAIQAGRPYEGEPQLTVRLIASRMRPEPVAEDRTK